MNSLETAIVRRVSESLKRLCQEDLPPRDTASWAEKSIGYMTFMYETLDTLVLESDEEDHHG